MAQKLSGMKTLIKPSSAKSLVRTGGKPILDYPMQEEKISSRQYTLRVGAPSQAQAVEVSIDQGDWQSCRPASGYWWFDWSGYEGGEHEIIARLRTPEGKFVLGEPHEFIVSL